MNTLPYEIWNEITPSLSLRDLDSLILKNKTLYQFFLRNPPEQWKKLAFNKSHHQTITLNLELKRHQQLTSLSIVRANVTNFELRRLANYCTHLTSLEITDCYELDEDVFSEVLSKFELRSLTIQLIGAGKIKTSLSDAISNNGSLLQSLQVCYSLLILSDITSKCPKIRHFHYVNNDMGPRGEQSLSCIDRWKDLENLYLSLPLRYEFDFSGIAEKCQRLHTVFLNRFQRCWGFSKCFHLKHFAFGGQTSKELLDSIVDLPLHSIELRETSEFEEEDARTMTTLYEFFVRAKCSFQSLSIKNIKLGDAFVDLLCSRFYDLKSLTLPMNYITESSLTLVARLPHLEHLSLFNIEGKYRNLISEYSNLLECPVLKTIMLPVSEESSMQSQIESFRGANISIQFKE